MDAFATINEVKAGRLQPVYLLFGKEAFLRERVFAAIRRQAVPAELDELNVTLIDAAREPLEQALEMARTMPFLAPYRVIAVTNWAPLAPAAGRQPRDDSAEAEGESAAPTGDGESALLSYLANPSPTAVLVFLAGEGVDRRRKVYKALSARFPAVDCQPLKEHELVVWLRDRAEEMGKRLELEAARELVERVPAEMTLLDAELAKLVAYAGENPAIGAADVGRVVPGASQSNIFDLLAQIGRREPGPALKLLDQVLRQGEPAPRVLFMIARQLRLLLTVKVMVEQGHGPRSIEQKTHLYSGVVRGLIESARGFARQDLVRALKRVLEADLAVKTSQAEPRLVLQLLVMDLGGRAPTGR